jgi:hypothetical protein
MRSHDRIMAAVDNKPNEAGTKTREAGPILHLTQFNHFLRAIGLELLSLLQIKTKKGRGEGEPAKPVIQTSLSTALTRCCVHILPILVSITIVSLNLGHIFLGSTIPGIILDNSIAIAIFQVLAKLQELLIIASLATLVFEVVRDLMIFGDGVPLGFLGSGFMFSDISYRVLGRLRSVRLFPSKILFYNPASSFGIDRCNSRSFLRCSFNTETTGLGCWEQ